MYAIRSYYAVRRMTVFFNLGSQCTATGYVMFRFENLNGTVKSCPCQTVPFDCRIAGWITEIEKLPVFDKKETVNQYRRNIGEVMINPFRETGGIYGFPFTPKYRQPGLYLFMVGGEEPNVITSYSIHYTKLYDPWSLIHFFLSSFDIMKP